MDGKLVHNGYYSDKEYMSLTTNQKIAVKKLRGSKRHKKDDDIATIKSIQSSISSLQEAVERGNLHADHADSKDGNNRLQNSNATPGDIGVLFKNCKST